MWGTENMADDDNMLREHKSTWVGFCRLMTWSLVAIVIVLLLMRCTLV